MKCINHAEREAELICIDCGNPVCAECCVQVSGGDFCRKCLEKRVARGNDEAAEQFTSLAGGRSKIWAFILSFLPGAGYMYLGLMRRGLETMILFFGTVFVSSLAGIDELIPFVLPVLFFYSLFDTQRLAGQLREGYPVGDAQLLDWGKLGGSSTAIAYALIGLGVLALANNLVPWVFHNYGLADRLIPPVLILAAGLFILYRSLRKGE